LGCRWNWVLLLAKPGALVFFVLPFRLLLVGCGFPGYGLPCLVFTGYALPVLRRFWAGNCFALYLLGGKGERGCNGLLMGLGLIAGLLGGWGVGGI